MIGGLNQRRGTIVDSEVREDEFTAIAEVALNDMFGYSSQLRGATQGKGMFPVSSSSSGSLPVVFTFPGEFSMEYKVRLQNPFNIKVFIDMVSFSTICLCCHSCKKSWKTHTRRPFPNLKSSHTVVYCLSHLEYIILAPFGSSSCIINAQCPTHLIVLRSGQQTTYQRGMAFSVAPSRSQRRGQAPRIFRKTR